MITNSDTQSKNTDTFPEPCFRLIYRSHSRLEGTPQDVEASVAEILRVARTNNRKRGITGALVLYKHDDRFAQVLEGPETELRELFARIEADKRHDNVEIKQSGEAPSRIFKRWAMALVVDHGESDVPLVATTGGLAEAEPWRTTSEQDEVLNQLREMTRAYGRGY